MKKIMTLTALAGSFMAVNMAFLSPASADVCRNYTVRDSKDSSVNLRTNPNGRIIRAVRNGTQVTATGEESNGWLPVQVGKTGVKGWMEGSRLTQNDDYVIFDPNDTFVNIRKQPNGQIIGRVPNGTTINEPMNYVGEWASVPQFNGFINGRFIRQPDCSP